MEVLVDERWRSVRGYPGSTLRACLEAAVAAPSIHNTQPWRLRAFDGAVDVLADPDRRLAVIDPAGRAMLISVGAALFNLRVAMLSHGRTPMYRLANAGGDPLVARVAAGKPVEITETVRELARAIPRRHTNRRPFTGAAVPPQVCAELVNAAAAEGAGLVFPDPPRTESVLALVHTADSQWRHDPSYRAELDRWTRAPGISDGVPPSAFGPLPTSASVPVRDFGLVRPVDKRPAVAFERTPTVAVLYTIGDDRLQRLRAGQALQRMLLTATVRGVACTPMTQPLEIPSLRTFLVRQGARYPQAIVRLGYGPPTAPTPRRPLSDILITPGRW